MKWKEIKETEEYKMCDILEVYDAVGIEIDGDKNISDDAEVTSYRLSGGILTVDLKEKPVILDATKLNWDDDHINHYIEEIRSGKFKYWNDDRDAKNGIFEIGVAVLETKYSDIELNIYSESLPDGSGYENKICLSYFICLRGGKPLDWEEFDYPEDYSKGYEVSVDFSKDNWRDLLKEDMEKKLIMFLEEFGCKAERSNWETEEEFSALYFRITRFHS